VSAKHIDAPPNANDETSEAPTAKRTIPAELFDGKDAVKPDERVGHVTIKLRPQDIEAMLSSERASGETRHLNERETMPAPSPDAEPPVGSGDEQR
jgi:hypothetical protein